MTHLKHFYVYGNIVTTIILGIAKIMLISVAIGLCLIVNAFPQDEWESLCFHFEDCKKMEELPAYFHPLFENEPHAPCLNESIRPYVIPYDEYLVS